MITRRWVAFVTAALALACSAPDSNLARSESSLEAGERQQLKLWSPEATEYSNFGFGQMLRGDELLVAEPAWGPSGEYWAGTAWLFTRDRAGWHEERQLKADVPSGNAGFGERLGLSDDQIFVNVPPDDAGPGRVLVFPKQGDGEPQVLTSEVQGSDFGSDFAVRGSTLLVGAPGEEAGLGAIYFFSREGDDWQLAERLVPGTPQDHGDFGWQVSLSDTVAAVCATSIIFDEPEVIVFEKVADNWLEKPPIAGGPYADFYNDSRVVIDETQLFMADPEGGQSGWGAVQVYARSSNWQQPSELESSLATFHFGNSVALDEDFLAVSAREAVAVFARHGEQLEEVEQLWPDDPNLNLDLTTVTLSGDTVAVSAPDASAANLAQAGAVFVFAGCDSDADCGTDQYCAADARCHGSEGSAASCERAEQCRSGHCSDGVCCNTACGDSCEACAEPGQEGRCVAIEGAPRPNHAACLADELCGGSCSGLVRSCSYAPARTPCGSSCTEQGELTKTCDGAGACADDEQHDCGGFVCREGACLGVCRKAADCRDGKSCVSGSCVGLSAPSCSPDELASLGPLGSRSCGTYRCDAASGACLSACSSSSQCAPGNVCDARARNCVGESARKPDAGCSCRNAHSRPSGGLALAGALTCIALALRRRQARVVVSLLTLLLGSACTPQPLGRTASVRAALSSDAVWAEPRQLKGADGFGAALAASGKQLLVGSYYGEPKLLEATADGWQVIQTLPSASNERCSEPEVALDDDVALLSSRHGARVFERDGDGVFVEGPRLLPAASDFSENIGCSLRLHGKLAALAERGKSVLFERDQDGWQERATLDGWVTAITEDTIFVTRYDAVSHVEQVDLYRGPPQSPELELTLSSEAPSATFGGLVVADAASVIVRGAGVLYGFDAAQLDEPAEPIKPPDDGDHPNFGDALALAGDVLLVGDPASATVHAFRGSGKDWKLTFSVVGGRDLHTEYGSFGSAVALADDEVVVGASSFALGPLGPFGSVFVYGRCASDVICPAGYYCAADAFCVPAKPLGEACLPVAGADCLDDDCPVCDSGHCVDGVCCDSRCGAQCQACNETGSAGQCLLVHGEPRGAREACAGSDDTCRGSCQGEAVCQYPDSGQSCGSACEAGRETPATCGGRGDCLVRSSRSCLGYGCAGDACSSSCADDADCMSGFRCRRAECVAVARERSCSEDGTRSITDEGQLPCGSYQCDPTSGDCREDCTATTDCAVGLVCDVPHKACVRVSAMSEPAPGCGCRLGARSGTRFGSLLLATAMLCCVARRRARRLKPTRSS